MFFGIACPGRKRKSCKCIPSLLVYFCLLIQVKLVRLSKLKYCYQYSFSWRALTFNTTLLESSGWLKDVFWFSFLGKTANKKVRSLRLESLIGFSNPIMNKSGKNMFFFLTAKHPLWVTQLFRKVIRVLFLLFSLSFTVLFPGIDLGFLLPEQKSQSWKCKICKWSV